MSYENPELLEVNNPQNEEPELLEVSSSQSEEQGLVEPVLLEVSSSQSEEPDLLYVSNSPRYLCGVRIDVSIGIPFLMTAGAFGWLLAVLTDSKLNLNIFLPPFVLFAVSLILLGLNICNQRCA